MYLPLFIFYLKSIVDTKQVFLDSKTKVDLYYSFIYPHLIYDIEFLGQAPDYLTSKVLISQNKALCIITT